MKYIIAHKENGYLYRAANSRWERTNRIERAELLDYDKAENVIMNCISPSMRQFWQIISEEDAYRAISIPVSSSEIQIGDFDWKSITSKQQSLFRDLRRYSEQLTNELSQVDLEICDIQHYIEFFALDAAKGYKAYRMLKERLVRRREIKDEMAKTNCILAGNPFDFSSGKITKQIDSYDKKSYTPRVLSELFDLDCHGRYSKFSADTSTHNNCA